MPGALAERLEGRRAARRVPTAVVLGHVQVDDDQPGRPRRHTDVERSRRPGGADAVRVGRRPLLPLQVPARAGAGAGAGALAVQGGALGAGAQGEDVPAAFGRVQGGAHQSLAHAATPHVGAVVAAPSSRP